MDHLSDLLIVIKKKTKWLKQMFYQKAKFSKKNEEASLGFK